MNAQGLHLPVESSYCDVCQCVTDHVFCYPELPANAAATARMLTEIDAIGDVA